MSTWEPNQGESNEWYTPPEIFDSLGCTFQLDPCGTKCPFANVPASEIWTQEDDGLNRDWKGLFVWMNPPFGQRNGVIPWIEKFIENGSGIGLCRAYTSSAWFQDLMPQMDSLFFPRGKTKFIRPDGTRGNQPGTGVVLYAIGYLGDRILREAKNGIYLPIRKG